MPRIQGNPKIPGTPFRQIMALRPDIAKPWTSLDESVRFNGVLEPELKEEVRRMVAQQSGCLFCASLGDPQESYENPRWTAAVAYGKALASNPKECSEDVWQELRIHFSDTEIVELTCWIAFMFAGEMFGAAMQLLPATSEQKSMYANWIKAGVAKAQRLAEQT
jgi:alkylhydroperoxidase family enzyme